MPTDAIAFPRYAPTPPSTLPIPATFPEPKDSTPPSSISELVCGTSTHLPPPQLANIHASKHNPDFRIRNQEKVLKIGSILSSLQLHLQLAHRAGDQSGLDRIYARVLQAGKGLDDLPQCLKIPGSEAKLDEDEDVLGEIMSVDRADEWYRVAHAVPTEEGAAFEVHSKARIREARAAYEAKVQLAELELGGGTEENGELTQAQDESQKFQPGICACWGGK